MIRPCCLSRRLDNTRSAYSSALLQCVSGGQGYTVPTLAEGLPCN
ncbi:hypothetical protein SAMN05216194_103458 [Stutzerimonas kunmingensis]|nr:hypothetical protein SAMN05216194_103458 [Stutzerimonas kunmingensis]